MRRARLSTAHLLLVLLATALVAGCATSPIELAPATVPAPGEGVAFGRVQLIEDGEQTGLTLFGESKFGLFLTAENSPEAVFVPLEADGAFVWHLPAGRYAIASFERRRYGTLTGRVNAGFEVRAGRAAYIGTLAIVFSGLRYAISVVDDYETASKELLQGFPDLREGLARDLMRVEESR